MKKCKTEIKCNTFESGRLKSPIGGKLTDDYSKVHDNSQKKSSLDDGKGDDIGIGTGFN